jgi:predicted DNA-binding transcriptional regulator AlpA
MEKGSSKIIRKEEAMAILGRGRSTLYRYIRKGYIRTQVMGRWIGVYEDDVRALKKEEEEPSPIPLNRKTISLLYTEVKTLRMQMNTVLHILDVRHQPLNLTAPEYQNLYRSAEQHIAEGWSPHVEQQWADTFVRMKVEDLAKIAEVANDPHPWRVFLHLVNSMFLRPYTEELRDLFATGKNNIEHLVSLWAEVNGHCSEEISHLIRRDTVPTKRHLRSIGRPPAKQNQTE